MRRYEIDFAEPPAVGTAIMLDGVKLTVARTTPHVRMDGEPTTLIVWKARCVDCGGPYETATGLRSKTVSKRCAGHRKKGFPATAAAAARLGVAKRAWGVRKSNAAT